MPITNARLRKAGSCAWLTFLAVFAEALGCGSQALKSLLMSDLVFYQGGDFARMVQVASADSRWRLPRVATLLPSRVSQVPD